MTEISETYFLLRTVRNNPHRGWGDTFFSARSLRSLPLHCAMLCATALTGGLASERVARAALLRVVVIENDSQNICVPVNVLSTTC